MSEALIDELSNPEYASLSDQAAADAINAKTVVIRAWVDTADVITHASTNGYYANIQDVADQPAAGLGQQESECRKHAINILKFVESPKTRQIDMDSPAVIGMKQAIVGCGFASQQLVESLDALANKTIRWTESVGLPEIGVGLVQNARKMMGV